MYVPLYIIHFIYLMMFRTKPKPKPNPNLNLTLNLNLTPNLNPNLNLTTDGRIVVCHAHSLQIGIADSVLTLRGAIDFWVNHAIIQRDIARDGARVTAHCWVVQGTRQGWRGRQLSGFRGLNGFQTVSRVSDLSMSTRQRVIL